MKPMSDPYVQVRVAKALVEHLGLSDYPGDLAGQIVDIVKTAESAPSSNHPPADLIEFLERLEASSAGGLQFKREYAPALG